MTLVLYWKFSSLFCRCPLKDLLCADGVGDFPLLRAEFLWLLGVYIFLTVLLWFLRSLDIMKLLSNLGACFMIFSLESWYRLFYVSRDRLFSPPYKFGRLCGITEFFCEITLCGLLDEAFFMLGYLIRYDGFERAGCCTDSYLVVDTLLLSYCFLGRTVRLDFTRSLLLGVICVASYPCVPP